MFSRVSAALRRATQNTTVQGITAGATAVSVQSHVWNGKVIDRQTDRQTDREREKERQREANRQREEERESSQLIDR